MNTSNTNVPDSIYAIPHGFGSQRSFFSNGSVAGAGGDYGYAAHSALGGITNNSYQTRRLVPLGVCRNISYFSERVGVCMRNQHIRRTRKQTLDNTDHLRSRFTLSEDYFRKTLSRGSRMIHFGVSQVFVVEVLDMLRSLSSVEFVLLVSFNKFFQFSQIHNKTAANPAVSKWRWAF